MAKKAICSGEFCGLPTGQDLDVTMTQLKALADPVRLRIVSYIANSGTPTCICSMPQTFNVSQPTLSHHLKKLVEAGILRREMQGTSAFYTLEAIPLADLGHIFTAWTKATKRSETVPSKAFIPLSAVAAH